MPKTTKDAVDEVILKAVERNPANGNLGCPQRFSQTLQASKRSRERSSSSSSTEMEVIHFFITLNPDIFKTLSKEWIWENIPSY